ncbi:MAG: HAMP domain-containing histidine kinase [Spirochaetia bacterium]|jgi:two-component system sensor histidine kinase CpxA|nr:HAMP domain-containing histidine kinase [Spirochaetia bacterium]
MTIVIAAMTFSGIIYKLIISHGDVLLRFQTQIWATSFLLREKASEEMPASTEAAYYTKFLGDLAKVWDVNIWLEDKDGNSIASNSWKKRPKFPGKMKKFDEYGIEIEFEKPPFGSLIVRSVNGERIFYIVKEKYPRLVDFYFLAALAMITIIIAMVLLPVSRKITKPLKNLTESANAISRGEFDKRVLETSSDEVGELAKAFNIMSGRVLQMIDETKKLTANISHQICSPLTRISVSLEILRDKIHPSQRSDADKILSSVMQEIESMVRLTNKIIEFIRVDTAHENNEYSDVSLTDTDSETAMKFGELMKQRKIKCKSEYSKIPIVIKGVKHDINELFDILYDNAVRYSAENGNIKCSLTEKNHEVIIEITNNTDTPVPDEALGSVFKPFQRFAPERIPGNGLGLAIAEGIAGNHGGVISATSTGSTFTVQVVLGKNQTRKKHKKYIDTEQP